MQIGLWQQEVCSFPVQYETDYWSEERVGRVRTGTKFKKVIEEIIN